jgi:hypothetical protein
VVEAEIDVRGVDGDIGVVLRHLPWTYTEAGYLLSRPSNFREIPMQPRNQAPERSTNRSKGGLGACHHIIKGQLLA